MNKEIKKGLLEKFIMRKKFKASKCPNCGQRLEAIWENEYLTYSFNFKTGKYRKDPYLADIEIKCPNCQMDLRNIFSNGVCNYKSKNIKNKV